METPSINEPGNPTKPPTHGESVGEKTGGKKEPESRKCPEMAAISRMPAILELRSPRASTVQRLGKMSMQLETKSSERTFQQDGQTPLSLSLSLSLSLAF